MSDKPVMTGISLTEFERAIVADESKRRGLYNFSATLRQIIREWHETQQAKAITENTQPSQGQAE